VTEAGTSEQKSDLMTARHPQLAGFVNDHAIRHGSFTLASGRTSSYYCDGKQVTFSGAGAMLVADAVIEELTGLDVDAVGGMDMGATPIVSAVALRAHQRGREIPSFIVRKEQKGHGTKKQTEGLLPGTPSRLVMIDDVVTTGGSIIEAIKVVQSMGHEVVLVIAVLDRDSGGQRAFDELGIRYQPLVRISELGISND